MSHFFYDRYPLLSHKGNFSGKASAFVNAIIPGEWWRSDPSNGEVPVYVEKNAQWDLNQGPVDMSIKFAKETEEPTTVSFSSGYKSKERKENAYLAAEEESSKGSWREIFVWHPFSKKEENLTHSVQSTKY